MQAGWPIWSRAQRFPALADLVAFAAAKAESGHYPDSATVMVGWDNAPDGAVVLHSVGAWEDAVIDQVVAESEEFWSLQIAAEMAGV